MCTNNLLGYQYIVTLLLVIQILISDLTVVSSGYPYFYPLSILQIINHPSTTSIKTYNHGL